jgi:hypothetical protein
MSSEFTKDMAGVYLLSTVRDMKLQQAEANRTNERLADQNRDLANQARWDAESRDQQNQQALYDQEQNAERRFRQQQQSFELAKQQQAQVQIKTTEMLAAEINELKIMLSLPEAERARYLRHQENMRELERRRHEELREKAEIEDQKRKLLRQIQHQAVKKEQQAKREREAIHEAEREEVRKQERILQSNKRAAERAVVRAHNKEQAVLRYIRSLINWALIIFSGTRFWHGSWRVGFIAIGVAFVFACIPIDDKEWN